MKRAAKLLMKYWHEIPLRVGFHCLLLLLCALLACGPEVTIHYTMPLPHDVTGENKTTDTVKIAKNGDRRESWLSPSPTPTGLEPGEGIKP